MLKIRPSILVGIGPQSQRTIKDYVHRVRTRQGRVPAILPVLVDFSPEASSFRRELDGIQYLVLPSPVFQQENEWPTWLPVELGELPPMQRERTRAWMRAALLQKADELQEFLLESIPRLSSFAVVEEMSAGGLSLKGDSKIDVYVLADLNDHLGSGVFVDVAYLTSYVCRQLGLDPLTVGLLYLPSATSPAPMEEAIAYAALKELDHYFRNHIYDGDLVPDWAPTEEFVPFTDGCYLLDSVNELGYTLQDASQQISAASEWLYTMTFLDMATAIRERRKRRYLTATLRGKARAYESFGIAVCYVPKALLVDWAAARLAGDILGRMLGARAGVDPEKRSLAFVERIGLRIDALEDRLRQCYNGERIDVALASLHHTGFGQIELRARQVLQSIRERHLPALDRRFVKVSERAQQEIGQAMREEVQIALEDMPVGGVPFAYQFLDIVHEQVSALQKEVEQQIQSQRLELRRSLATISKTHYTLRSVVMSIPPWPVSILAIVSLLILPLVYGLQLVQQVIRSLNQTWGDISLGILALGVLGVLGFMAYRFVCQSRLVHEQHVHLVRERFEMESKPLVNRAINAVYSAVQETIKQAKADLDTLVEQLQAVAAHFRGKVDENAEKLERLALPGPFRSVVDLERAEQFSKRVIPNLDSLIVTFTQEIGPISDWQARSAESAQPMTAWLDDQLSLLGTRYLEQRLQEAQVLGVLTQGSSDAEIQRVLERMFESAHPLWNYDPRALRRAKTQRLTLLGIDTLGSAWASLVGPVVKTHPDAVPIDTGDPFTMVVLNVHRGVPFFALRRIGEYRTHYAETLWRSKLPVHTMRAFALADDLIPVRQQKFAAATLFAVGLALGSIGRDTDGRYLAPRGRGRTIRLSPQKERSVALMSLDITACREVQRQLSALISQKGKRAIRTILDEYMTVVPGLEDWEVKGILEFSRTRELGNGSV